MEDIYFDKQEELIELGDFYYWTSGSEGLIYRIPDGRKNMLMKLFFEPNIGTFLWPDATIKNKEKKVQCLKAMALPNKVQVKGKIFLQNEFIGYFLNEAMDYQDFCFNSFTTFQKLGFLKRLRNQLVRFHKLGIIYGDLKSNNVLAHYRNYRLGCLCDLDNMQIKDLPIDIKSNYVDEFLYQYGKVDEKLDWYVLNLLTLESIHELDQTTDMAYHETRAFMDHYRGNCEALREMQHVSPHYEGSLLIEDPTFYEEIGIQYYKKN